MSKEKPTIKEKLAITAIRTSQRLTVRRSKKDLIKLTQKYETFINEIQDRCGEVIELVKESDQGKIVAILCTHIMQGFDTKKETDLVLEMIKVTMDEYWKRDEIPQNKK